jgi:hypothetical protein
MLNPATKLLTSGDLYYSTDYVAGTTLITALTATNQVTVQGELAALTYTTLGYIKNFQVAHSLEDEKLTRVGNCGVGEIDRSVELTPTISFDWLDVDDIDAFASILGLDVLNVAASPVVVTNEILLDTGSTAAGQQFTLQFADGDGTAVSPLVIQNNATPLVLNTDYTVSVVNGQTVITMITVNATAGIGINADYTYTPNVSQLVGYNIEQASLPYGLYKFVSCVNEISTTQGIQDTIYFLKFVPNAEVIEQYIDRAEQDFVGSPMSLVGVAGGMYLKIHETVAI